MEAAEKQFVDVSNKETIEEGGGCKTTTFEKNDFSPVQLDTEDNPAPFMTKKEKVMKYIRPILCGVCLFIILLGFSASLIHIARVGTEFTPTSTKCPDLPRLNSMEAEKQLLSRWHWRYEVESDKIQVQATCPMSNQAEVLKDGKLVARSAGFWDSDWNMIGSVQTLYVKDCHGNQIYRLTAGFKDLFLFGFTRRVSFSLWDENGVLIGYCDQKSLFQDEVIIKSGFGNPDTQVAYLKRKTLTLSKWKWEITVNNVTHPASDPRILLLIAGRISFRMGDKDRDMCNAYFWNLTWVIVSIVAFVVCILCCLAGAGCYKSVKRLYEKAS